MTVCFTSCKTGARLKVTLDYTLLKERIHDRDILKLKASHSQDANDWLQLKKGRNLVNNEI